MKYRIPQKDEWETPMRYKERIKELEQEVKRLQRLLTKALVEIIRLNLPSRLLENSKR